MWLWFDLEERAFVAENGPEAAGFVDQIAGAVGAVHAGGCVRKVVKLVLTYLDLNKNTRDLQKMLKNFWSFSELDSTSSEGAQLMKVTANTKTRAANWNLILQI